MSEISTIIITLATQRIQRIQRINQYSPLSKLIFFFLHIYLRTGRARMTKRYITRIRFLNKEEEEEEGKKN